MKLISCEKLEKSMVELQFSIDAETFKSAVNTAFKREGKKYAIPGFRKGKAPKAMIEKMYGKDLFQYDAINDLFPENYEAAVKEAGIEVVGRPDPEVVSMSEDEGATLKVKVAVKPEVELGEYTGLTVNKDVKTVDEADVDAEIKQNYTFGCRTPWALNDEHNWQRTQRMGGYTFVVMGIVLLVLAFLGGLLGDIATLIVLLAAVLGGSAWIYLYSYLVYVGKMK